MIRVNVHDTAPSGHSNRPFFLGVVWQLPWRRLYFKHEPCTKKNDNRKGQGFSLSCSYYSLQPSQLPKSNADMSR